GLRLGHHRRGGRQRGRGRNPLAGPCGWAGAGRLKRSLFPPALIPNGSPTGGLALRLRRQQCDTVVLDTRVVTGTGGGPEKTILNSPRFLSPAGYRNLCAYMHPPGDAGFEQLQRRAEACWAPLLSVTDRGPWD